MKEVFQPVYFAAGSIVGISQVVFPNKSDAKEYATMVCKRSQTFEVVKLEVIENDPKAVEN